MFEQGEISFSGISGFLENNSKKVSTSSIAGWSAPYKMPNELNDQGISVGLLAPEGSSFKTYRFSEFRGIVKSELPVITSDSIIHIETNTREFNFSYQIVADNMTGDINYPFLFIATNYPTGLTFNSNTGLLQGTINLSDLGYSAGDTIQIVFNVFADNYAGRDNVEVTVNVVWNQPPTITILGDAFMNHFHGVVYNDAGATASDLEDGDLTSEIITTNNVNTGSNGEYTVDYEVTDSGGLTTSGSRIVNIINNPPVITLLGDSELSVPQDSVYIDSGATAFDTADGDITSRIVTNNPVDISTSAIYEVTYNVTDLEGAAADEVIRTVIVDAECAITKENGDSINTEDNETIDVEFCLALCTILTEDGTEMHTEAGEVVEVEIC